MWAMPSRTCGSVMAGVDFFSVSGFPQQEPGGDQRERLMMVPAVPVSNLIVRQAGFALAALDTFFDSMLGLGDAREFGQRRLDGRVGQVVVGLDDPLLITITITDHDQYFRVLRLPLRRAGYHT